MSGETAGAILDSAYLITLWFPGILLARALGLKHIWASLTVGFLFSTVTVVALFHLTALFDATNTWWMVSKVVLLILLVLTAAIVLAKRDSAAFVSLGIAFAISAVAVVARNILRLDGNFRGPDQFLVGWISSLAQSGHDPSFFGGSNYVKRGFAVPLLLAQGREGQLLLSVTIVILVLVLISTFLLASSIGTRWNSLGISLGVAFVIVWITMPIVWGMAFFLNGHALMALAVASLAAQVVGKDSSIQRTRLELLIIFAAGFTLASTRPEGVALALILSFPLFVRPVAETRKRTLWRLAAMLGAPIGFVTWFMTANFFSLSPLATLFVVVGVIFAVTVVFFAVYARPTWHHVAAVSGGIALVVVAVIQLLGSPPGLRTLTVFVSNSFLGAGQWGLAPWLFAGVMILHTIIKVDKRVTRLVELTAFAVIFTVAVKIVDGLVIIGGVPGLSLGWFDSVNRSFFHLIALPSALFLNLGMLSTRRRS